MQQGWITPDACARLGQQMAKTEYGQYLIEIAGEGVR